MALQVTSGKSEKTDLEKDVRIAMVIHNVTSTEIAEYEGVTQQAIYNRLKRLTYDMAIHLQDVIAIIAAEKKERYIQKAAG